MRQRSGAFDCAAQELIGKAVTDRSGTEGIGDALNAALQRLEQAVAAMVGNVGFQALFLRALDVTGKTGPDPKLAATLAEEGWRASVERVGDVNACAAASLLFANCLELLASFIGEDLTFRLLKRAFGDFGAAKTEGGREP